jgi:geranylgeranyl diphosphate synthase type II
MQSFSQLVSKFEDHLSQAFHFPVHLDSLYEPCRYFLQIGGKRVRPVLCLMANELFGEINNDALHAATGVELFHNFTLVHDDIMDKAPLRRGKKTLHERNGLTAGILCGDILNIYAYDQLSNIQHRLPSILKLFNQTSIEVCEGQQMDMDFESRNDVSIAEYIEMITLKTSVLLACSLKMGALLGNSAADDADKLYQFGKNLGIAFQLRDDYLDAFGNAEKTGKQVGGDILANKKTYLAIKAFENATQAQKETLTALQKSNSTDKVKQTLECFEMTGARKDCELQIENYSQNAFNNLEEIRIEEERKTPLKSLATYLLTREN